MQKGNSSLRFGSKPINPGTGAHSGHILRRATSEDIRAFRWLSPTFFDIKETYESIIELLCPSTCGWIQFVDEFQRWLQQDSSALLSIFGPPGCGKSVLAAYVISSLKRSPQVEGGRPASEPRDFPISNFYKQQLGPYYWEDLYDVPVPLAYIFCEALPVEERTSLVILSILLAQLARQSSSLLTAITERMERSQHASATFEELIEIFKEDLKRNFSQYYLIIDGLDHINGSVELFLSLVSDSSHGLKLLIFSRSQGSIPDLLISQPKLIITQHHTENDIQLMLKPLIPDVVAGHDYQFRSEILKTFLDGHKGSFVWCRVFAKYLEHQNSFSAGMFSIPTDIFELYKLAFEAIAADPDPVKRNTTVRLLAWIAIAQRPLDISELQIALTITEHEADFRIDAAIQDLSGLLGEVCSPLLDVRNTSFHGGMYSVFSKTVTLIHPTLEDFLFHSNPSSERFGLPLNRQTLHSHIATACLSYLSLSELGNPDTSFGFQRGHATRWQPPIGGFLSYAAIYVFDHISYSGSAGAKNPRLLRVLRNFITTPRQIQSWTRFISAASPLAKLVSRHGIPTLRYDCDIWHPGLSKFKKWLADLDPDERAVVGDEVMEWPERLMKEVWDVDLIPPAEASKSQYS